MHFKKSKYRQILVYLFRDPNKSYDTYFKGILFENLLPVDMICAWKVRREGDEPSFYI